jgi:hypothetical protein
MMFLGSRERPVRGADNLTVIYESIVCSHNPTGLHGLLRGSLRFFQVLAELTAAFPTANRGL